MGWQGRALASYSHYSSGSAQQGVSSLEGFPHSFDPDNLFVTVIIVVDGLLGSKNTYACIEKRAVSA